MKKRLAFLCAASAAAALFSGCGGADVTESTVELKKKWQDRGIYGGGFFRVLL